MPKDQPPPKKENETAFQRFQRLAQRIISAPKNKVEKPQSKL